MTGTLDVQFFPHSGSWIKPAKAAVVNVVLIGGPTADGTLGEITANTIAANTLPDKVNVEVGAGGFAFAVTHLQNDGTHPSAAVAAGAQTYVPGRISQYPVLHMEPLPERKPSERLTTP